MEAVYKDDKSLVKVRERETVDNGEFMAAVNYLRSGFDPEVLTAIAPHCHFHIIDCSPQDPAGYMIERYDLRSTLDHGMNYQGMRLGEYPVQMYSRHIQEEFGKARGSARLTEVMWRKRGEPFRRYLHFSTPLYTRNEVSKVLALAKYDRKRGFPLNLFSDVIPRTVHKVRSGFMIDGRKKLVIETQFRMRVSIDPGESVIGQAADCLTDNVIDAHSVADAAYYPGESPTQSGTPVVWMDV